MKILVVEPDMRRLVRLKKFLEVNGYVLRAAQDGKWSLKFAQRFGPFDVVISRQPIPGVNLPRIRPCGSTRLLLKRIERLNLPLFEG